MFLIIHTHQDEGVDDHTSLIGLPQLCNAATAAGQSSSSIAVSFTVLFCLTAPHPSLPEKISPDLHDFRVRHTVWRLRGPAAPLHQVKNIA